MPESNGNVLARVRVASANAGSTPSFDLHRFPAYIGTEAACDVRLDAGNEDAVAGRHAQLLALRDGHFRLVNLSTTPIVVQSPNLLTIAPRKVADLAAQSRITIGPFTLELLAAGDTRLDAVPAAPALGNTPRVRKSAVIGLELYVQDTHDLAAGGTVRISAFIKNNGDAEQVAFAVNVIGVDEAFCEANSGPTLNPGGMLGVVVAIKQPAGLKDEKLPAGDLIIGVRVSAAAYAGQPAEEVEMLHVLPVYEMALENEG